MKLFSIEVQNILKQLMCRALRETEKKRWCTVKQVCRLFQGRDIHFDTMKKYLQIHRVPERTGICVNGNGDATVYDIGSSDFKKVKKIVESELLGLN